MIFDPLSIPVSLLLHDVLLHQQSENHNYVHHNFYPILLNLNKHQMVEHLHVFWINTHFFINSIITTIMRPSFFFCISPIFFGFFIIIWISFIVNTINKVLRFVLSANKNIPDVFSVQFHPKLELQQSRNDRLHYDAQSCKLLCSHGHAFLFLLQSYLLC